MPTKRPNVVVLICDNQRFDTLSLLHASGCQTPTWDRIAREGILFDNLRCTSPICAPARASLFTGLQPQQAGLPHNPSNPYIDADKTLKAAVTEITVPHMAHYFRQAGYECIHVGKWHLGSNNYKRWFDWHGACGKDEHDYTEWCGYHGIADGFVFHDPVRARPFRSLHPPHMSIPHTAVLDIPEDKEHNAWIMARAFELFGLRDPQKPLFMVVSTEGPHPPFLVPEKYHEMYDPEQIPEPTNWRPAPGEPSFLATSYYRRLRNEWGADFSRWRKAKAVYWGYVTYIDSLFQRFIARLEREGLGDDTLLAMVSDHGEMMGQHGLWQKFCPYEEALRVPWVMRWPGVIAPGSRCSVDASGVDVAATLLAAADVDVAPLGLEGQDLLADVRSGHEPAETRDCFSQYNLAPTFDGWHGVENWRLVVRRPWKYVLHQNGEEELYNLAQDAFELENRIADRGCRQTADRLQACLLDWCQRTADPFLENLPV